MVNTLFCLGSLMEVVLPLSIIVSPPAHFAINALEESPSIARKLPPI